MPTGFSSRRARQSQITGKIGAPQQQAPPPQQQQPYQSAGADFQQQQSFQQQPQQSASFAPPRDTRSAGGHFSPNNNNNHNNNGLQQQPSQNQFGAAAEANLGGTLAGGGDADVKHGRRARTVDAGDAARKERARQYQEELREQMEARKRAKEDKKNREKQEDVQWERQLEEERARLKAREEYDIQQEQRQKAAQEEAKFGGPPKKGRRANQPAEGNTPGGGAPSVADGGWGMPTGGRGGGGAQQQSAMQQEQHHQQPASTAVESGQQQVHGRMGQYRLPPSEGEKKAKDEAFQEELRQQMLAVQKRKADEQAAREKADRDYDRQVEAWGNSEQSGMAWKVKKNNEEGGGSKIDPNADQGGTHNNNNHNNHQQHQAHQATQQFGGDGSNHGSPQGGGQGQGHLPAFLQDDAEYGGGVQQQQQQQQQPSSHNYGAPSFLDDPNAGGYQQAPPLGGGGYGGGYGGQAPPYDAGYGHGGGPSPTGGDRTRDEIVGMLLEQKRQIQDLHTQQQHVVNTMSHVQPIPVPGPTVAMPPPAHRGYQANYHGHQGQGISGAGGSDPGIHTTQVYVDNPENLLQRFLKEEDRQYGAGPTTSVVVSGQRQSPQLTGPPSYSGVGGGGGGGGHAAQHAGDSPDRHQFGGRGRSEVMESAMSLGGDTEYVEGGGELTTDTQTVPLTKRRD